VHASLSLSEIRKAMAAYRDGTRKHEIMSLMAKPLSDADIDDLAAWFGSLKMQVQLASS